MAQTWARSTWKTTRRVLAEIPDQSLWRGDVIRFVHDPSLGPGSPPAEFMLFETWGYDDVLGLLKLKGYKAGLPFLYFPKESQGSGKLSLETSWLLKNWDKWFVYSYHTDENEKLIALPLEGTLIALPLEGTLIKRRSKPAPRLKI
ncbi:hypothetical protein DPM33_08685 [Mesorhizobium hawassense]|uniref:Immunity protein 45 domain-containing protein n=1 Tax=Mesorhizobium hawassense TaxID=1209954 RepID=A0A330HXF5_9HYPH|nr:Imm45 family immunity protein [Mesorhizobium hawassense]RAZ91359.1 hypothetical protein DPM33_08685 [Mesorhizobium hawassense]